jgi:hypothetical protein
MERAPDVARDTMRERSFIGKRKVTERWWCALVAMEEKTKLTTGK